VDTDDLDGATLMQNDIHRINEKINALSLRPQAHHTFTQDFQTRRENEKSLQSDWKPRYDSLPHPPHPTPASLARHHHPHPSPNYTRNNGHFPTSDFDFSMRAPHLVPHPPPRSPLRETVTSMNTDLAGYPFSPEGMGMQWPVPPGYSEANGEGERGNRESGIGYSTGSWQGVGERERERGAYLARPVEREGGGRRERGGWS
jgi:FtsZ-binding cell division protein ZapB